MSAGPFRIVVTRPFDQEALEPLRRLPARPLAGRLAERVEALHVRATARPRAGRASILASAAALVLGFLAVDLSLGRPWRGEAGGTRSSDPLELLHAIATSPSSAQELLSSPEVRLMAGLTSTRESSR